MNTLTEDEINTHLNFLLNSSEPGATVHHLILAVEGPKKTEIILFAIAPDDDVHVEMFIAKTIAVGVVEQMNAGKPIVFAGLSMEANAVEYKGGNNVHDDLARHLHSEHRLEEHPESVEVTRLYAAHRDGRRWTGDRYLTGAKAGVAVKPTLHTGAVDEYEAGVFARLLRGAVGL